MAQWEDDNPDDSEASEPLVYEQVKMLWDDQVALADTLRDKRKTTSSLLAVLIGLGIFRLQLYQDPKDVLVVHGNPLILIRWSMLAAILCFMAGAYFLYSERPNCRRLGHWIAHSAKRGMWFLWRKARSASVAESREIKMETPPASPWPVGRAIGRLFTADDRLSDWFEMPALDVIRNKTQRLFVAYRDLQRQNRRVGDRLRLGVLFLLLGYGLIFTALCGYVCSALR